LTPIRLAAERLRMKLAGKLDATDKEMLDRASNTIVSQVEALRTLVDAFGDYAREPMLTRSTIKLDELIREVVTLYQQGDATCAFDIKLCAGPEGLQADSGRLRQMLHNLIRNAMEASSPVAAKISISGRVISLDSHDWMQLEIRDHGPGFPAAILERPFEPYVTHKVDGSGLGLAICRKIVSEHDGRIAISNPADGGALVTILLPLEKKVDTGAGTTQPQA
jgi:nitrogen fixation/metabolism regulation signal transduction histidine kinase